MAYQFQYFVRYLSSARGLAVAMDLGIKLRKSHWRPRSVFSLIPVFEGAARSASDKSEGRANPPNEAEKAEREAEANRNIGPIVSRQPLNLWTDEFQRSVPGVPTTTHSIFGQCLLRSRNTSSAKQSCRNIRRCVRPARSCQRV